MAILINDNYSLQAQNKAFDARYFDGTSPWADTASAIAGIPTYRYQGLTINVNGEEYWWKNGIGDGDLVKKSLGGGGTLTGVTNGITLFGTGDTIGLGGNLTTGTTITTDNNELKFQSDTGNSYSVVDFALNSTYSSSRFGICARDGSAAQWGFSGDSTSIVANHYENASNYSSICIENSGVILSNTVSSDLKSATMGVSGLTYGSNYCDDYSARSLVDKGYVDSVISGCSNVMKYVEVNDVYSTTRYDDVLGVSGISSSEIILTNTPIVGQRLTVVDICGNALFDPIIVNGNNYTINGMDSIQNKCSVLNTNYGSITYLFNGRFWSTISFVN